MLLRNLDMEGGPNNTRQLVNGSRWVGPEGALFRMGAGMQHRVVAGGFASWAATVWRREHLKQWTHRGVVVSISRR